jgi:hypothetical protein
MIYELEQKKGMIWKRTCYDLFINMGHFQITSCFHLCAKGFQLIHICCSIVCTLVRMFVNRVFWKFTKWRVINLRTLTERHVVTFRKQFISLLCQPVCAILLRLSEIKRVPFIILNKAQSFITG